MRKGPERPTPGMARTKAAAILLVAAIAAGCTTSPAPGPPIVAVSVAPQGYFVKRIAGDLVRVEVMVPPGANPAVYAPTARQVQAASEAALYVKVGHPAFPFEHNWLDSMIVAGSATPVVDGSKEVLCSDCGPHNWVSPACVRATASSLAAALERVLPEHRQTLRANLESFRSEIDRVDRTVREALDPHRGRRFLVFHPSWGCFARDYGLLQVAIERDGKEPSPRGLSSLIDAARNEGLRVVFVQPQFSSRAAETIAAAIGGRTEELDPLAADWPENLIRTAAALRDSF